MFQGILPILTRRPSRQHPARIRPLPRWGPGPCQLILRPLITRLLRGNSPLLSTPFLQGVLQEEGLSLSQHAQEPRNTAPATSIPTSVEIGPVDAVNDRVIASQSSSSSAFPFVASQCTTQGQQFALRPPMSVLPQTGFRLPLPLERAPFSWSHSGLYPPPPPHFLDASGGFAFDVGWVWGYVPIAVCWVDTTGMSLAGFASSECDSNGHCSPIGWA